MVVSVKAREAAATTTVATSSAKRVGHSVGSTPAPTASTSRRCAAGIAREGAELVGLLLYGWAGRRPGCYLSWLRVFTTLTGGSALLGGGVVPAALWLVGTMRVTFCGIAPTVKA